MKRYLLPISFVICFLVPNLLFSCVRNASSNSDEYIRNDFIDSKNNLRTILIEDKNGIVQMELEEYIVCVLLGEIPANFETEALKAQAVATRTYTLRRYIDNNKHETAHVCVEASCCQAYLSESKYLSLGHTYTQLEKVKAAVMQTSCQVLTFNGELIEATYFSCAGDKTESAVDVWGVEVPYLVSVESPGEENSKNYQSKVILTVEKFVDRLGLPYIENIQGDDIIVSYTAGGGVEQAIIAGEIFSGQDLRAMLDLPSTVIRIDIVDEIVKITTKGNGHRVGMSQYGAQAMAQNGKSYEEILMHYYSGVKLHELAETQLKGIFDKEENL